MITYVQVMIYSQCKSININLIGLRQTIISVIEAIAIYHNIGKSLCQS